jgi:mRNA interferase MazF
MNRGELWWASLHHPRGSEPGYRRPVVIVQSNAFNQSQISTVIVAAITSNLNLAQAPGNILISRKESGLSRRSIINVSQVLTINKCFLTERIGVLPARLIRSLEDGLRLVFSL